MFDEDDVIESSVDFEIVGWSVVADSALDSVLGSALDSVVISLEGVAVSSGKSGWAPILAIRVAKESAVDAAAAAAAAEKEEEEEVFELDLLLAGTGVRESLGISASSEVISASAAAVAKSLDFELFLFAFLFAGEEEEAVLLHCSKGTTEFTVIRSSTFQKSVKLSC